jgi:hypothetical protein
LLTGNSNFGYFGGSGLTISRVERFDYSNDTSDSISKRTTNFSEMLDLAGCSSSTPSVVLLFRILEHLGVPLLLLGILVVVPLHQ